MPEADSPGNCKSSVSIPRKRASRSIYFEPVPSGCREREGGNDPIGNRRQNRRNELAHSSREYVQGILFISRAELKSSSWRLLAYSHLVILISGSSFYNTNAYLRISAVHVLLAGLDVLPRLGYAKRNYKSRQRK